MLVSGIGYGNYELSSFDNALIDAGISNYNLVKVSSILPPKCFELSNDFLPPQGSILFTAYAAISSNTIGDNISATISIGIPKNDTHVGVIMEHSSKKDSCITSRFSENMVLEAMKSRKEPIENIISRSSEAEVLSDLWTTAFAAVVMW